MSYFKKTFTIIFETSNYQARYERNIPTTNTKYFSGNCILYRIYLFSKKRAV
jgi:hypothetical protein